MVGGLVVGSKVIAPIARVACDAKMGVNVVPPLVLIHTPPPEVPMNNRPEVVGSTAMAVTFPVALDSAPPRGSVPKKGISPVIGRGPSAVQNGVAVAAGALTAPPARRCTACIDATAFPYASRGTPKSVPRRFARYFS